MEPICQTQSIVELRFSSVKIKQLRRFGRFYLLRVSTSKRSPKRMQLSLIVGIAFGFWLISDLPISGWSGFPHFRFSLVPGFNIFGLRINLHLTLQSRLNRRFIRGCSPEISIFWSKMRLALLIFWFSSKLSPLKGCFTRHSFTCFELRIVSMGFKNGRIPAVSKAHLLEFLWSPASQGLKYGSICESVPVMN